MPRDELFIGIRVGFEIFIKVFSDNDFYRTLIFDLDLEVFIGAFLHKVRLDPTVAIPAVRFYTREHKQQERRLPVLVHVLLDFIGNNYRHIYWAREDSLLI